MNLSLNILLVLSSFIFSSGVLGIILHKRNLLIVLISIELMLLGVRIDLEMTEIIFFVVSNLLKLLGVLGFVYELILKKEGFESLLWLMLG